MTAIDLEQPPVEPGPPGRHRLVHLVCCHPDRGLCGADVSGLATVADRTVVTCTLCDAADEAGSPCGAFLCRLRQWTRQHLGSAR